VASVGATEAAADSAQGEVAPPPLVKSPALKRDLRFNVADGASYGVMVGGGETYLQAFVLAIGLGEVFVGLGARLAACCN
jgi:hypothetical protein